MKIKLLDLWDSIRTSLWFIPFLMAGISIILAQFIISLDKFLILDHREIQSLFYAGGPEGARLLLSSIAGSMITVAGVTFSITMVALTMTTSQFGPRLLRNFMADRVNQVVLGAFIATFIYCLLVLRSIQETGGEVSIPRIAVSLSIVLVLINFGLLIYFFHHVSTSIHADNVIDSVYRQMETAIDKIFPGDRNDTDREGQQQADTFNFADMAAAIPASVSGYFRALDEDTLLDFARDHDIVIKLHYRPGDYIFAQTPLLSFLPAKEVDPEMESRARTAFVIGSSRSPEQDIEFSIKQLVEVALRALSPGINDPYTAISCIDRLGSALCLINGKHFPSPYRYDDRKKLRLILDMVTYSGILDAAFNQIRQYGRGNVDILIRLMEILHVVSLTTNERERLESVRRHGNMVYRASLEAVPEKDDRGDVDDRYQTLKERLDTA
ncbi:MAG: DUF2254 domain-containing protein [Desulfobulbaceae bacterium]|nr:DUF2254 domain-containing protein [Desulfobulbaceae bacterium]